MAVIARRLPPRPSGRPMPRTRPLPAPVAKAPRHEPPPPPRRTAPLVIGGLAVVAAVVAVAMIWIFGAGRDLAAPPLPPPPTAEDDTPVVGQPPLPRTTNFYRVNRNGRVTWMEIDEKGTTVRGTIARKDVPLDRDEYRERRFPTGSAGDPDNRIQALGSAFR